MKVQTVIDGKSIYMDTEDTMPFKINGVPSSMDDFDGIMQTLSAKRNIDLKKIRVENKYLRKIIKKDKDIFHVLESPKGVYPIDCRDGDGSVKTVKVKFPNIVMVLRFSYMNGKYIKRADRIFHTAEPVNKELSNVIYHWGASNVYEDMNICWGNSIIPQVDNNTSYQILDEFLLATKNKDLIRNKKIDWSKMNTEDIYEVELSDVRKTNVTIMELIENNLI